MILDVVIEDARWDAVALNKQAEVAVAATLAYLELLDEDWEVTVLGCDDARIADLNAEFREKPKPTNVLSWPAQELAAAQEGGGNLRRLRWILWATRPWATSRFPMKPA